MQAIGCLYSISIAEFVVWAISVFSFLFLLSSLSTGVANLLRFKGHIWKGQGPRGPHLRNQQPTIWHADIWGIWSEHSHIYKLKQHKKSLKRMMEKHSANKHGSMGEPGALWLSSFYHTEHEFKLGWCRQEGIILYRRSVSAKTTRDRVHLLKEVAGALKSSMYSIHEACTCIDLRTIQHPWESSKPSWRDLLSQLSWAPHGNNFGYGSHI